MKRMDDCFIDLTITSPPYDNLREYKGYEFEFQKIANELFRVTKEGGVVIWIVGDSTIKGSETGTSFKQALYFKEIGFNLHDTMIYKKNSPPLTHKRYEQNFEYMFVLCKGKIKTFNPIYRKKIYKDTRNETQNRREKNGEFSKGFRSKSKKTIRGNIWEYSVGGGISSTDKISFLHPAIFPEQLVKEHIYSWSNEEDLVYDSFMGSGTTAKMAYLQKRKWIGSEISKEYTELANKRIEKYINQTTLF
jgi:site-specific DNA-methyltransferase (adenine-specific)